ncbi:PilN family type IVB pilus formation outer membrane protein [Neopusillimonas maritima]|uniref:PilN family type IVB pilus formation outer membrane protein n=1 Tax=Neopusillimonas maritima TaxID=2026239 RepID=A0A3A1YRY8_9BURK|nr:PilN family type IVB pilus formation outer membrane protein [Neopusillimonas maritima]RIY41003.1 PilN family type IVB pilus formation outer membrane protein [Neopusillimonas maritima]
MNTARNLKRLATFVIFPIFLSGCAVQRINDSVDRSQAREQSAMSMLERMRQAKTPREAAGGALIRSDSIWVDTNAVPAAASTISGKPSQLDCPITFIPVSGVTISEFANSVTSQCGIPVRVTQDALAMLNGYAPGGSGGQSQNTQMGALPSPNLAAMGNGSAGNSMASAYMPINNVGNTISGINWKDKPLKGLLDQVTARLGLGWKLLDGAIVIFHTDTRVFHLYAIPGVAKMSSAVKSGADSSNSSGSNSTNNAAGSFSSEGSSQSTGLTFETNIIEDIDKTIKNMLTPQFGRSAISPSTGTVTVTDRPEVLDRIAAYLENENKRITRQVLLNVKVLAVTVNDTDSMGINWEAVYESLDRYGVSLATGFPSAAGGASGSIGIMNPSSRWNGTELLVDALSTIGRVSTVTAPSVTTLNLQPAPVLVGSQQSYLASVSTTDTANVGSTSTLTPGTITTGFNMTLLPYLMEGPDMLLQYSINLSSLTRLREVESGGQKIEIPEVANRIFSQRVRLRSGETLILSGFEQSNDDASKEGVGDSGFWLFGGQGSQNKTRDVIVILITPVVME